MSIPCDIGIDTILNFDGFNIRPEPPELDIEKILTEDTDMIGRWFILGQWETLPTSPMYRAKIYKLLATDVKTQLQNAIRGIYRKEIEPEMEDSIKDIFTDLIRLIDRHLWLIRFHFDLHYKQRIKIKASEGQLGIDKMRDRLARSIRSRSDAVCSWMEEMTMFWRRQRIDFSHGGTKQLFLERTICWFIRTMAHIMRYGFVKFNKEKTFCAHYTALESFQNMYPALGIMVGPETTSIQNYSQKTLIAAIDSVIEYWYETPFSVDLCSYVEHLYNRFIMLLCTTYKEDGQTFMNHGKMNLTIDETELTGNASIPIPHSVDQVIYDIGLHFDRIDVDENVTYVRSMADRATKHDKKTHPAPNEIYSKVHVVTEEYVQYGERKLCPLMLQIEHFRYFVLNKINLRKPYVQYTDFMESMKYCMNFIKRRLVHRSSEYFISKQYTHEILFHMVNPGEAEYFKTLNSSDDFSAETIINVLRSGEMDRIKEHIINVDYNNLIDIFGGIFENPPSVNSNLFDILMNSSEEEEESSCSSSIMTNTGHFPRFTPKPNINAYLGSYRATVAIQYACFNNFFIENVNCKEWSDIVLGGAYKYEDEVRYMLNTMLDEKPHLEFPFIFRIAGSFMVYLPWEQVIVHHDDMRYHAGSLAAALYVAMRETLQYITTIPIESEEEGMDVVIEEQNMFLNICKIVLEDVYGEKIQIDDNVTDT